MRPAAIALVALTCICAPAAAQTPAAEIFGGYSFVHDPKNDISLPAGWIAGGALRLSDWLSAVADASGGYRTGNAVGARGWLSPHALLFRPRARARHRRLAGIPQPLA